MELFDVFISYRRGVGTQIAEALYTYLTERGLRVFRDQEKLENGDMFPPQLERNLRIAPNFVLIGTEDAFRFRQGKDWVRTEIKLALEEYNAHRQEQTLTVLVPEGAVLPDDDDLPEDVAAIANVQRIPLTAEQEKAFGEVFRVATRVNRGNLWMGAQKWLEESRAPGGRFAGLNICETILPLAGKTKHTEMPVYVRGKDTEAFDLFDTIGMADSHLYLIGQGGIGKTTALMHIMDYAYNRHPDEDGQLPIFVELSFAPDTYGALYSTEVGSFIRRSIYRQIRTDLRLKRVPGTAVDELDEIFTLSPDVAVRPINDLFSRSTGAPEYLLLLDGLNEVSRVVLENGRTVLEMVVGEIDYLMRACPNVRILLTSRSDEMGVGGAEVGRLYLTGIDGEAIRNYLKESGTDDAAIDRALGDAELAKTLQIPLFLTMYATLSQGAEAVTQGEILRLFFHQRSQNMEVYTAQDRLSRTTENLRNAASRYQRLRPDAEVLHFLLDFVLPELGWHMERSGLFHLSAKEAEQVLEPLLTGTADTDVCGAYGKEVFARYRKEGSARHHTRSVVTRLREVMGEGDRDDLSLIIENILTCCVGMLGILHENRAKFGFVHQHIRDYFAAVKHINTMTLALHIHSQGQRDTALACMEPVFRSTPVGMTVRRFVGEYLGEHRNTPVATGGVYAYGVPTEVCDRSLIDRVLTVYRGRFEGEGGYGLHSLLRILKEVRGALAGCDLSDLDLVGCGLNGARLGMPGLAANLRGARFRQQDILFRGHGDAVRFAEFSADGQLLLTASDDGRVCVWDARTGLQRVGFSEPGELKLVCFTANGRWVITASAGGDAESRESAILPEYSPLMIHIWNSRSGAQLEEIKLDATGVNAVQRQDKKYLLLWNCDNLWLMDTETMDIVLTKAVPKDSRLDLAAFAGDGNLVLHRGWRGNMNPRRTELMTPEGKIIRELTKLRGCKLEALAGWGKDLCILVHEDGVNKLKYVDPTDGTSAVIWENRDSWINSGTLSYSNGGRWLILEMGDIWRRFDTADYRPAEITLGWIGSPVTAMTFHEETERMALGTYEGGVQVYETVEYTPVFRTEGGCGAVASFCLSPDGRWLALAHRNSGVELWDLKTHTCVGSREYSCRILAFSSDGKHLSVDCEKSYVLSVPDLQTVFEGVGPIHFSACGRYFTNYWNHGENLYALPSGDPVRKIPDCTVYGFFEDRLVLVHTHMAEPAPDENGHVPLSFARAEMDSLMVQNVRTGEVYKTIALENAHVLITVGGHLLALGNREGKVTVYDIRSGEQAAQFRVCSREGQQLAMLELSENGRHLMVSLTGPRYESCTVIYRTSDFAEVNRFDRGGHELKFAGQEYIARESGNQLHIGFTWAVAPLCRLPMGELPRRLFVMQRQSYALSDSGNTLVMRETADRLRVYALDADEPGKPFAKPLGQIAVESGVDLLGVDLHQLHPDCRFTPQVRKILRQYGAIMAET